MTRADPSRRAPELKFTALDLTVAQTDGAFEGYASLFGREDLAHDAVSPGAFRQSLAERGTGGIRMLFQHDANQPIGVWTSLSEDARGLYAKGQLSLDVPKARDVLALMRDRALDGLSIGYKPVKFHRDAKGGTRWLDQVDLWEISIVTFPMLPGARVSHVKSQPFGARAPTEREFERWLTRDAGFTRSQARAVLRSGLKGLRDLRDAGEGGGEAERLGGQIRRATQMLRSLM
ncbi:MAG: HK97 family phage prohead protease [Hyphomicrobium sp.]